MNADSFLRVFDHLRDGKLVSIFTPSCVLKDASIYLRKLSHHPIVIHATVSTETRSSYAGISDIRQCGFSLLHSESLQDAQDMALTAHALAMKSGKGVIHFFDALSIDEDAPIQPENREIVDHILHQSPMTRNAGSQIHEDLYIERFEPLIEHKSHHNDHDQQTLTKDTKAGEQGDVPNANTAKDDHEGVETNLKSTPQASAEINNLPKTPEESRHSSGNDHPITSDDIDIFLDQIWDDLGKRTKRQYHPFNYRGPIDASFAIFMFGSSINMFIKEIQNAGSRDGYKGAAIITPRVYRPWLSLALYDSIPQNITRIAVMEQVKSKGIKWGPLLLDVINALRASNGGGPLIIGHRLGVIQPSTVKQALRGIFQNSMSREPIQNLDIGGPISDGAAVVPNHEAEEMERLEPHERLLHQVFAGKLYIANRKGDEGGRDFTSSPAHALGELMSELKPHSLPMSSEEVGRAIGSVDIEKVQDKEQQSPMDGFISTNIEATVESRTKSDNVSDTRVQNGESKSRWIIVDDKWSPDIGNTAMNQLLISSRDINMLIIDRKMVDSQDIRGTPIQWKKDIGLYAMNQGNAYVASVAVYGPHSQTKHALVEADAFDGPSIVLAYYPSMSSEDFPLEIMQETQTAIQMGNWPLYRYNPRVVGSIRGGNLCIDSDVIKEELKKSFKGDSRFKCVMRKDAKITPSISACYESEVQAAQLKRAKEGWTEYRADKDDKTENDQKPNRAFDIRTI